MPPHVHTQTEFERSRMCRGPMTLHQHIARRQAEDAALMARARAAGASFEEGADTVYPDGWLVQHSRAMASLNPDWLRRLEEKVGVPVHDWPERQAETTGDAVTRARRRFERDPLFWLGAPYAAALRTLVEG